MVAVLVGISDGHSCVLEPGTLILGADCRRRKGGVGLKLFLSKASHVKSIDI